MSILERAILEEVSRILKEEAADEEDTTFKSLKQLDTLLNTLGQQDEMMEFVLSPYTVMRDIFKVAVPSVKLVLNDISFMIKAPLAIRPSSWEKAKRGHAKRKAKITREYDAAMKASGADSGLASMISFLAMPQSIMDLKIASLPIKAVAGVNRALIDSGIRLPLVSMLPGATPPEEAEMSDQDLKDKKRGDLTTKDAVKVALMVLFFAHHKPTGNVLTEKAPEKSKEGVEKVNPATIKAYLEDTGVYDKFQEDLKGLFTANEKSVDTFLEGENWQQKIKSVYALISADTPEKFIKTGQTISSGEMRQEIDKYIKSLKESAQKIANDKKFQEALSSKLEKDNKGQELSEDDDKVVPELPEDVLKKEALDVVFAETQGKFRDDLTEHLRKYMRFVVGSVESLYPPEEEIKDAMKNPIVEKAYESKDKKIADILSNIRS